MTTHQRITSILLFAALAAAAMTGTAPANSLLSGYGGPGEGNQAILGSALLNAPKGGGSGGGGAGVIRSSTGQTSGAQSGETTAPQSTHRSSVGTKASARRQKEGAHATKTPVRSTASQAEEGTRVIYPAASREVTTGGSRALGLSGADFVYIILALGVLAVTGFLTVRLTRPTATTRGPTGTRG
ncbi:MAG TPA: hypothetical protein VN817_07285 [Solirubrobacteraceae bacterium]|nr:hypothetical protein [Solirubrobacteraceae bacterium]